MSSYYSSSTKKPKQTVMITVTVLGIIVLVLITGVLISWLGVSFSKFTTTELTPNCKYTVADRNYIFPDIEVHGKCLKLQDYVIEDLRELFKRVHKCFAALSIPYHLSGGTLLGAIRHGAIPMPWDDDLDIHTDIKWRTYLFSPEFRQEANRFGLETSFIPGASLQKANCHQSCTRFFLKEKTIASGCLDCFFLKKDGDATMKIDSWIGDTYIPNPKEQFLTDDVYPRDLEMIDGMSVWMPYNPKALLFKQYGKNALSAAYVNPKLGGHSWIWAFLAGLVKPTAD